MFRRALTRETRWDPHYGTSFLSSKAICRKVGMAILALLKLYLARWHTAQSRLLRVYFSNPSPEPNLGLLARYIVCVYVPMVLKVKQKSDFAHSSRHLAEEMQRQRRILDGTALKVAQDSTARSALMAHPESIVMGMLSDEDRQTRSEAIGVIRAARQSRANTGQIRQYRVQKSHINRRANSYLELVYLASAARAGDVEPPYIKNLSMEQVEALVESPIKTGVPGHTQSTERSVKLTTESVGKVAVAARQDGKSLNKKSYRERQKRKQLY